MARIDDKTVSGMVSHIHMTTYFNCVSEELYTVSAVLPHRVQIVYVCCIQSLEHMQTCLVTA